MKTRKETDKLKQLNARVPVDYYRAMKACAAMAGISLQEQMAIVTGEYIKRRLSKDGALKTLAKDNDSFCNSASNHETSDPLFEPLRKLGNVVKSAIMGDDNGVHDFDPTGMVAT